MVSTRQIVDIPQLQRSEIYNDYLNPRGLHEGLRLSLWVGDHDIQDISILRPWSVGPFGKAEADLGRLLMPHLQRAASVTRRLRQNEASLDAGRLALDSGDVAVISFERSGVPVSLNRAAEDFLSRRSHLKLVGGDVQAATPAATRELRRAIARASSVGDGLRDGGVVRLPDEAGSRHVTAMVVPVGRPGDWTTSRPPAAMLLLRDPAALTLPAERLADLFGLTAAEVELARHLLAGLTLRDIAARQGRSLHTIRNHLARLMHKTETGKQSELLLLLSDMAALGGGPTRRRAGGPPDASSVWALPRLRP